MKVQVQAPFQVSQPMQNLIQEKVDKLTNYFDRIIAVDVFLKDGVQRHNHKEDRQVEFQVEVPGQTFFAEDSSDSFEKSIANSYDKVERQLRKYKDQLKDHR